MVWKNASVDMDAFEFLSSILRTYGARIHYIPSFQYCLENWCCFTVRSFISFLFVFLLCIFWFQFLSIGVVYPVSSTAMYFW